MYSLIDEQTELLEKKARWFGVFAENYRAVSGIASRGPELFNAQLEGLAAALIAGQNESIVSSEASVEEMAETIDAVRNAVQEMKDQFRALVSTADTGKERQEAVDAQIQGILAQSQALAGSFSANTGGPGHDKRRRRQGAEHLGGNDQPHGRGEKRNGRAYGNCAAY